tara:strand:- start:602 stop:1240 length:639 start_codon:yes stop_codon:yes gene_type:complete
MFENLLYLPLDIENAPKDCLSKLNDIDFQKIYRDDYRNCWHVPLMAPVNSDYHWTPISNEFKSLVDWAEDCVFPLLGKSRIMIITTLSGTSNPPHIDCSPKMFNTLQHKFRCVLQGNIDDLVFMSSKGDVYLEETIDKPFIMSGKWPHYMLNSGTETKFTFAFGHPWDGDLSNNTYFDLLNRSQMLYNDSYMTSKNLELPYDYERYYEDKYK